MKTEVRIRRDKEERKYVSFIGAFVTIIVLLSVLGLNSISIFFENKVSCNGIYSCLLEISGSLFITLILTGLVWFMLFLIYYFLFKWKDITIDKSNSKKRKK